MTLLFPNVLVVSNVILLSTYCPTVLLFDLGRSLFSFLIQYTVGRTPWTEDQPVARPLPTHRKTQIQNKPTQTFMPRIGFESTIPAFERGKTVHALDRAATVIGCVILLRTVIRQKYRKSRSSCNVGTWIKLT
jgi:hypothetical protein